MRREYWPHPDHSGAQVNTYAVNKLPKWSGIPNRGNGTAEVGRYLDCTRESLSYLGLNLYREEGSRRWTHVEATVTDWKDFRPLDRIWRKAARILGASTW